MKREWSEEEEREIEAIIEALESGGFETTMEADRRIAELVVDGRVFDVPELAAAVERNEDDVLRVAIAIGLAVLESKVEGCGECGIDPAAPAFRGVAFDDDEEGNLRALIEQIREIEMFMFDEMVSHGLVHEPDSYAPRLDVSLPDCLRQSMARSSLSMRPIIARAAMQTEAGRAAMAELPQCYRDLAGQES